MDTLGLLLAVSVHAAHISETCGIRLVLLRMWRKFPNIKKIWVDGGYKAGCIQWAKLMLGYVVEVVQQLGGVKGFHVLPNRWVVERTFGWLAWHRRLNRDYEHNYKSSEANIKIVMIGIMLNSIAQAP